MGNAGLDSRSRPMGSAGFVGPNLTGQLSAPIEYCREHRAEAFSGSMPPDGGESTLVALRGAGTNPILAWLRVIDGLRQAGVASQPVILAADRTTHQQCTTHDEKGQPPR